GDQPIQEMAPSIRGVRKAPCAHLVATRHARVERIFRNVDTQYSVDHCPILSLHLLSKSSASNNLVRRIYAHARPKIPSDLKSGAWKTGPNLWDRLTRQAPTQAHRSPRCWRDLFIRQAICNVQVHTPNTSPTLTARSAAARTLRNVGASGFASCGEIVRVALEPSVHQRIGF